MELYQIEQEIIYQCNEADGFLLEVHSMGIFDEEKYQKLVTNLKLCKEKLGDSKLINRQLAWSLFGLEVGLSDAVSKYEDLGHPVKDKVGAAHAEIWLLVDLLLSPPQLENE